MITYIIRRLLYSVLVLIAASFLVFTFVAKGAGDPLGAAPRTPNVDQEGLDAHRGGEAPQRLDLRALRLLGAGRGHERASATTLLTNKPILPDLWRVMKNTLQLVFVAELLAILIAIGIGVLSALRQYSEVRLHGDDVQLPRAGDAALLARAHAPGARRADPVVDGLQDLSHRQPQRRRPGQRLQLLSSTAPTTWPCP